MPARAGSWILYPGIFDWRSLGVSSRFVVVGLVCVRRMQTPEGGYALPVWWQVGMVGHNGTTIAQ